MTIFNREVEEKQITDFLASNLNSSKSGLMYLCGHPGTGKTSLLNQVLSFMEHKKKEVFELFTYNAMTYSDVR